MKAPDRILREDECRKITGLGRTLRHDLEARGEFPKRRKITERITGYSEREVLHWVNERLHGGGDA